MKKKLRLNSFNQTILNNKERIFAFFLTFQASFLGKIIIDVITATMQNLEHLPI